MNLIRKVVDAKVATNFTFNKSGTHFIVKNLSNERIYACLGNTYVESKSVVVLPYTSDNLIIDKNNENSVNTITIYSENGGEIEVQCLELSNAYNDINEVLEKIKNATYGKDVRQAIHDGIQIIYNLEKDLEQRMEQLEK